MDKQQKEWSVHEVSALSGISIRTLHYYDEIGLLKPKRVAENGYRLYGTEELKRLQDILLFRELEFPLAEIRKILESPEFDRKKALEDRIRLLSLQRERIDGLILHAERLLIEEESNMNFHAYDKEKIEAYQRLAKEAWGNTEAYREFEARDRNETDTGRRGKAEAMMDIFYEFGNLKNLPPEDEKVQAEVKKLQDFITANYYTCTDVILASLGKMYTAGGEMTANIDAAGGAGCADFVAKAIEAYCRNK